MMTNGSDRIWTYTVHYSIHDIEYDDVCYSYEPPAFRLLGNFDYKDVHIDSMNIVRGFVMAIRIPTIRGHPRFWRAISPSIEGLFDYENMRKPSWFDGFLMSSYSEVERSWLWIWKVDTKHLVLQL